MSYYYKTPIGEFDLETINNGIEAFCDRHDVPANKLFSIQLVIEELVTNIIRYGKSENNGATIQIMVEIGAEGIVLQIVDDSSAFNPLEVGEPDTTLPLEERNVGGLGLFLVRKKVRSLSYDYRDGFNVVKAVI